MNLLEKAIIFATDAHQGQKRKVDKFSFILHPLEVGIIISSMTKDEDVIAAGILHDTVEDTKVTKEDILYEFGENIYSLVCSETEERDYGVSKSESWFARKKQSIEELQNTTNVKVKMIWLADKLSNLKSIYNGYQIYGEDIWNFFHQTDKNLHLWYYQSIIENLQELKEFEAYKEFNNYIEKIFKEK